MDSIDEHTDGWFYLNISDEHICLDTSDLAQYVEHSLDYNYKTSLFTYLFVFFDRHP
jgi:hypothetical protein